MANIDFQTEDNINFYDLLKNNNLQENIIINATGEQIDETNTCLLTNMPLTLNSVTLPTCKHKFNYLPLLKELLRQKNVQTNEIHSNNHYYTYNSYSKDNVPHGYTKCPYCRVLNQGCLPYIQELYSHKYNDVNYPLYKAFVQHICKHKLTNGKRKGEECGKSAYEVEKDIFTCKTHKPKVKPTKPVISKKSKSITNTIENVIISSQDGCKVLLKTGKRNGEQCGIKLAKGSTMCLRHTNLLQKLNNNVNNGHNTNDESNNNTNVDISNNIN